MENDEEGMSWTLVLEPNEQRQLEAFHLRGANRVLIRVRLISQAIAPAGVSEGVTATLGTSADGVSWTSQVGDAVSS